MLHDLSVAGKGVWSLKVAYSAAWQRIPVTFGRKAWRLLWTSAVNTPAEPVLEVRNYLPCRPTGAVWALRARRDRMQTEVLACRMRLHPVDHELDCRTVGSADPSVGEGFGRNGRTAAVTSRERGADSDGARSALEPRIGLSACRARSGSGWPHPRRPRWIWCDRRTPSSRPPWPQRPYATFFPCEQVRIPRGPRKPLQAILHFVTAPLGCGVDRPRS
jgi:hypothetical protein